MATGTGSTKEQLPTLHGVRQKTRKRDEKQKLDITGFRDVIVSGIVEAENDLEAVSKFLDNGDNNMDYKTYGQYLLQIMIAGGLLTPGGTLVEDKDPINVSVLRYGGDMESVKKMLQVFVKLLRRHKYLQKIFEEELTHILKFLKGFTDDQCRTLACFTTLVILEGLAPTTVLRSLLNEYLTKEGIALQFLTSVFRVWLQEREIGNLSFALKKANLEGKLLEFLPPNKQTSEYFDAHFTEAGLEIISKLRRIQEKEKYKKELRTEIDHIFAEEDDNPIEPIISMCHQHIRDTSLTDVDVTILLWGCIMGAVEMSKKQDLAVEQALKHLQAYASVFVPFCERGTSQLSLIIHIQKYCYDHATFRKHFHKILVLLYRMDVVTEQAIMKWFKEHHSQKGKRDFLVQTLYIIEWLSTAEEESDTEEPVANTDNKVTS